MTILDKIFKYLDEEHLINIIDSPIDKAMINLEKITVENISFKEFNIVITKTIQHLYSQGIRIPKTLDEIKALNEAVWLTDNYYKGENSSGYFGALYDTLLLGEDGFEHIIQWLVEIIKSIERTKYITWILTKYIDPSDWFFKKKLMDELLLKYGDLLPPDVKELSSQQLIPYLDDLIKILISSNHIFYTSLR